MSDSKRGSSTMHRVNVGQMIRQSSFVKRQVSRLQQNSTSSSEDSRQPAEEQYPSYSEVNETKQVCDQNQKIFKKDPQFSNSNKKHLENDQEKEMTKEKNDQKEEHPLKVVQNQNISNQEEGNEDQEQPIRRENTQQALPDQPHQQVPLVHNAGKPVTEIQRQRIVEQEQEAGAIDESSDSEEDTTKESFLPHFSNNKDGKKVQPDCDAASSSNGKYAIMFDNYKARKEIIARAKKLKSDQNGAFCSEKGLSSNNAVTTTNKSSGKGAQKSSSATAYLSFLEKQVEKANTAYLHVDRLSSQLGGIRQRLDLMELQMEDHKQKEAILEACGNGPKSTKSDIENLMYRMEQVEDFLRATTQIGNGGKISPSGFFTDGRQTPQDSLPGVPTFQRSQSQTGANQNVNSNNPFWQPGAPTEEGEATRISSPIQWPPSQQAMNAAKNLGILVPDPQNAQIVQQMEDKITNTLLDRLANFLKESEALLMERCIQIVDQQGRDIAQDFSALDNRVRDLSSIQHANNMTATSKDASVILEKGLGGVGVNSIGSIQQNQQKSTNQQKAAIQTTTVLSPQLKQMLDLKVDLPKFEVFSQRYETEMASLKANFDKIRDKSDMNTSLNHGQGGDLKSLRALENRLNGKIMDLQAHFSQMKQRNDKIVSSLQSDVQILKKRASRSINKVNFQSPTMIKSRSQGNFASVKVQQRPGSRSALNRSVDRQVQRVIKNNTALKNTTLDKSPIILSNQALSRRDLSGEKAFRAVNKPIGIFEEILSTNQDNQSDYLQPKLLVPQYAVHNQNLDSQMIAPNNIVADHQQTIPDGVLNSDDMNQSELLRSSAYRRHLDNLQNVDGGLPQEQMTPQPQQEHHHDLTNLVEQQASNYQKLYLSEEHLPAIKSAKVISTQAKSKARPVHKGQHLINTYLGKNSGHNSLNERRSITALQGQQVQGGTIGGPSITTMKNQRFMRSLATLGEKKNSNLGSKIMTPKSATNRASLLQKRRASGLVSKSRSNSQIGRNKAKNGTDFARNVFLQKQQSKPKQVRKKSAEKSNLKASKNGFTSREAAIKLASNSVQNHQRHLSESRQQLTNITMDNYTVREQDDDQENTTLQMSQTKSKQGGHNSTLKSLGNRKQNSISRQRGQQNSSPRRSIRSQSSQENQSKTQKMLRDNQRMQFENGRRLLVDEGLHIRASNRMYSSKSPDTTNIDYQKNHPTSTHQTSFACGGGPSPDMVNNWIGSRNLESNQNHNAVQGASDSLNQDLPEIVNQKNANHKEEDIAGFRQNHLLTEHDERNVRTFDLVRKGNEDESKAKQMYLENEPIKSVENQILTPLSANLVTGAGIVYNVNQNPVHIASNHNESSSANQKAQFEDTAPSRQRIIRADFNGTPQFEEKAIRQSTDPKHKHQHQHNQQPSNQDSLSKANNEMQTNPVTQNEHLQATKSSKTRKVLGEEQHLSTNDAINENSFERIQRQVYFANNPYHSLRGGNRKDENTLVSSQEQMSAMNRNLLASQGPSTNLLMEQVRETEQVDQRRREFNSVFGPQSNENLENSLMLSSVGVLPSKNLQNIGYEQNNQLQHDDAMDNYLLNRLPQTQSSPIKSQMSEFQHSKMKVADEIREYEMQLKSEVEHNQQNDNDTSLTTSVLQESLLMANQGNISENNIMLKGNNSCGGEGESSFLTKSVERSGMLRATNDRLAKLEMMYSELQKLEQAAQIPYTQEQ